MESMGKIDENTHSKTVSTLSGPAGVVNARGDPKSTLRLVFRKKPKKHLGLVRSADASAEASRCSRWVYSEVVSQVQQCLQAEFGNESGPSIVEASTDRTVPPMVESDVRRKYALNIAKVAEARLYLLEA